RRGQLSEKRQALTPMSLMSAMSWRYCLRLYMLSATLAVSPPSDIRSVLVYTSHTERPLPSACQPPSTWYAAVATPHRKPAGKGLSGLFSVVLAAADGGMRTFQARRRSPLSVLDRFARHPVDARLIVSVGGLFSHRPPHFGSFPIPCMRRTKSIESGRRMKPHLSRMAAARSV